MAALPIAEPVVVTGATGCVGRRLVQRLLARGCRPRALLLPDDAVPIEWADRVTIVRGDVSRRADAVNAVDGAGTVLHLAAVVGDWEPEERYQRVTVDGTEHVLREAARQQARVVLVSSVVVYGHRLGRQVCDETVPFGHPMGPYGRSKQQQERIALALEGSEGLRVAIVRPCNVYGPDSRPWVDTLVTELRRGAPVLVDGGEHAAGLTHVDNVVDVLLRVAERPAAVGRRYNANDDHGVSWRRYCEDLAALVGAPSPRSLPGWAAALAAPLLERGYRLARRRARPPVTREALNLVRSAFRVPIDRATVELGYRPTVSYEQGMRSVADYLRRRKL